MPNARLGKRADISVCIVNFNYADYVGAAIDSALTQRGATVEVVVVDDGSTDDSRDVIARYADDVVVVVKENGGQASAMNVALEASTGKIVLFLDSDDELLPDACRRVVDAFAGDVDGHAVAKVQWRLEVIDANGVPTGELRIPASWPMPSGDLSGHVAKHRTWLWPPTSGGAYRRRELERIGPIPEEAYRIEADRYLSQFVPFCGPIVSLDTVLGRYRVHGTNNYAGRSLDASFFRRKIAQTIADHDAVVAFARALGSVVPEDALALSDPSFLGYRIASLRLEPALHPIASDRRVTLAWKGAVASLTNRMHPPRHRVKRALWFVAVAAVPRPQVPKLVRRLYG